MNTRSLFLTAAILAAGVSPVAAADPTYYTIYEHFEACSAKPGFHQWGIYRVADNSVIDRAYVVARVAYYRTFVMINGKLVLCNIPIPSPDDFIQMNSMEAMIRYCTRKELSCFC